MTRATRRSRPSLSTIVRRALRGECALPKGTAIVVAVSGGPDSMALLSTLARLGPREGWTLHAHGVDHGLRPEAAEELDLAEAFARSVGVPWSRTRLSIPRGGNLQARARELRWKALAAVARSRGAAIATAHHADDRAETVLMRLLRGAGLRGLGVLAPRACAPFGTESGDAPAAAGPDAARAGGPLHPHPGERPMVVRPLSRARRLDILEHLERHGVPFATDPSNDDPRYLRTQVRRRVLPLLSELDPAIVPHLEALADELVRAAPDDVHRPSPAIDETSWAAGLPRPTQEALATLLRTRSPEARVWLPGGLVVSVDGRVRGPRRSKRPGKQAVG